MLLRLLGLLTSIPADLSDQISSAEAVEPDAADAIYSEIESLANQGMSLEDISECLHVPLGEVDLVQALLHRHVQVFVAQVRNSGFAEQVVVRV